MRGRSASWAKEHLTNPETRELTREGDGAGRHVSDDIQPARIRDGLTAHAVGAGHRELTQGKGAPVASTACPATSPGRAA